MPLKPALPKLSAPEDRADPQPPKGHCRAPKVGPPSLGRHLVVVRTTRNSTVSVGSGAIPGEGRVRRGQKPSIPFRAGSATCQSHTTVLSLPTGAGRLGGVGSPCHSAVGRMPESGARQTCFCRLLRSRTIASNRGPESVGCERE